MGLWTWLFRKRSVAVPKADASVQPLPFRSDEAKVGNIHVGQSPGKTTPLHLQVVSGSKQDFAAGAESLRRGAVTSDSDSETIEVLAHIESIAQSSDIEQHIKPPTEYFFDWERPSESAACPRCRNSQLLDNEWCLQCGYTSHQPTKRMNWDEKIAMLDSALRYPSRLREPKKIVDNLYSIPKRAGIYAWYFDDLPDVAHRVNGQVQVGQWTLMYVGIAGSGEQKLDHRIRDKHLQGCADNSTLRKSVGVLLRTKLGLQPVASGTSDKKDFYWLGERKSERPQVKLHPLTEWLFHHARIVWIEDAHPSDLEKRAISTFSLPLNWQHNQDHPFFATLDRLRQHSKEEAWQVSNAGIEQDIIASRKQ